MEEDDEEDEEDQSGSAAVPIIIVIVVLGVIGAVVGLKMKKKACFADKSNEGGHKESMIWGSLKSSAKNEGR